MIVVKLNSTVDGGTEHSTSAVDDDDFAELGHRLKWCYWPAIVWCSVLLAWLHSRGLLVPCLRNVMVVVGGTLNRSPPVRRIRRMVTATTTGLGRWSRMTDEEASPEQPQQQLPLRQRRRRQRRQHQRRRHRSLDNNDDRRHPIHYYSGTGDDDDDSDSFFWRRPFCFGPPVPRSSLPYAARFSRRRHRNGRRARRPEGYSSE